MDLLNIFEVFARLRKCKKQMKMKYKHSGCDSKNFFEINKFTESVWPLTLLAMNWVFHKQFYDLEEMVNRLSYVSN